MPTLLGSYRFVRGGSRGNATGVVSLAYLSNIKATIMVAFYISGAGGAFVVPSIMILRFRSQRPKMSTKLQAKETGGS
jgi:hypothetical protein